VPAYHRAQVIRKPTIVSWVDEYFMRKRGTKSKMQQYKRRAQLGQMSIGKFPRWGVLTQRDRELRLVRIVAMTKAGKLHFVAGFETDGTVRRAAPIIAYFVGWSDARARAYIAKRGWRAAVVPDKSPPLG
jgi:hypothetical protein